MSRRSVQKFQKTLQSDYYTPPVMQDPNYVKAVQKSLSIFDEIKPDSKLSVGPTSCFEGTVETGGQTGVLKEITKNNGPLNTYFIIYDYNLRDLKPSYIGPRLIRCSQDLLNFCIFYVLKYPFRNRISRLSVINDQSKARVVTMATFPKMIICNFIQHLLKSANWGPEVRSGIESERHLWNFLWNNLNNENTLV